MRRKKENNIIFLDSYRKKRKNVKTIDKKIDKETLLNWATGKINLMLMELIHESNIDYAIGHLMDAANDIGLLYSKPGAADEHLIETPSLLSLKRFKWTELIKEEIIKSREKEGGGSHEGD